MAGIETVVLIVAFNLFSGVVALLVSYYAFQARRLIGSSVLTAMSIGFMLLGTALIVEVITSLILGFTPAEIARGRGFGLLENMGYLVLQVAALSLVAVGYSRVVYGKAGQVATAAPLILAAAAARVTKLTGAMLLLYYLLLGLQFVVMLLLGFIVFQGFLVYSRNRDRSSLLVLLGFVLVFLAHVIVLNSIFAISSEEYLIAAATQFLGFTSLLVFLVRSGRVGSA